MSTTDLLTYCVGRCNVGVVVPVVDAGRARHKKLRSASVGQPVELAGVKKLASSG